MIMTDDMMIGIIKGNNAFLYGKEKLYHLMYGLKIESHDKDINTLDQTYRLSIPERIFIRDKDTSKIVEVNPENIIKEFKENVILYSYGMMIGIIQGKTYNIERDMHNMRQFMHVYFKIRKGETWNNVEILDNMMEDDLMKFENDKANEYIKNH